MLGSVFLVLTFLSQIRTSRKQQVEAKFFEMVRYYRNNIEEMHMKNPFHYKSGSKNIEEDYVEGRAVMKLIFEQYKVARRITKDLPLNQENHNTCDSKGRVCCRDVFISKTKCENCENYTEYKKIFLELLPKLTKEYKKRNSDKFCENKFKEQFLLNEIAYIITYWGVRDNGNDELEKLLERILDEDTFKCLLKVLKGMRTVDERVLKNRYYKILREEFIHSDSGKCIDPLFELISKDEKSIKDSWNILTPDNSISNFFFVGNQFYLSHYFRHLYAAVEYIDNQPFWLFMRKDKYHFIKMLTSQMSNYELAMLFIDSLSQLGRNMDYDRMHDIKLITKYHMLKALPKTFIPDFQPQYFYPAINYDWKF
jgi:hypothetical protein